MALKELEKLSNAFPLEIRYLHNLASYYTKLGKESKALEVYRRILKIDINDASANMAITASNTGTRKWATVLVKNKVRLECH